jgi:glutamine amidotransferase
MGWNDLIPASAHQIFTGVERAPMYFTHSFALFPTHHQDVAARVDHGGAVVAAVARDNIVGVQFHPEKSQSAGLRLLANFLDWRP